MSTQDCFQKSKENSSGLVQACSGATNTYVFHVWSTLERVRMCFFLISERTPTVAIFCFEHVDIYVSKLREDFRRLGELIARNSIRFLESAFGYGHVTVLWRALTEVVSGQSRFNISRMHTLRKTKE